MAVQNFTWKVLGGDKESQTQFMEFGDSRMPSGSGKRKKMMAAKALGEKRVCPTCGQEIPKRKRK